MLPCLCQISFRANEGWIFQVLEETSESHLCLKKEHVNFITSLILAWLKFDESNILLVWMVYDPLCLFSVDFNCNKSEGCSCACPIRQWGFSTWLSWKTWKLTQAAHHWLVQFDWTCPRSFSMLTVSTMIFINDILCLDLTLWRSKTYEVPWYEHVFRAGYLPPDGPPPSLQEIHFLDLVSLHSVGIWWYLYFLKNTVS